MSDSTARDVEGRDEEVNEEFGVELDLACDAASFMEVFLPITLRARNEDKDGRANALMNDDRFCSVA